MNEHLERFFLRKAISAYSGIALELDELVRGIESDARDEGHDAARDEMKENMPNESDTGANAVEAGHTYLAERHDSFLLLAGEKFTNDLEAAFEAVAENVMSEYDDI